MRSGLKMLLAGGLALSIIQFRVVAEEKPAVPDKPADKPAAVFKDDKEKASYSLGLNVGNYIKRSNLDIDVDVLTAAMRDILAGKEAKLSDQQAQEAMRNYQQDARKKTAEKNKQEGETFLAENKKKSGVQVKMVALRTGGSAEMQYKVIKEGTGASPKSNDVVSVNYRGTFINGKEFDSNAKSGQPMKRAANRLIPGWTEALQMMKVGSKWELYLPAALAYGDMGNPTIEPGATLIFEMELVGIEAPPAPTPTQPLTSDIIKVPSADELKKGAKIEVIKPEDAAKAAQQAQPKK